MTSLCVNFFTPEWQFCVAAGHVPITIYPSLQLNVSAEIDSYGALTAQQGMDFTADVVLGIEFRRAWNK